MEKKAYPAFEELNRDPDEVGAFSPEVQKLYHQLGFLTRTSVVEWESRAQSKSKLGHAFKTLVEKMTYFLFPPLLEKQNKVNIQTESMLRETLHELDRLEKRVTALEEENAQLRNRLSEKKEN